MDPLPVDRWLDPIRKALQRHRAVVVVAAPGAGKSTRIPPFLARSAPTLLLQPRRAAARAIAQRIAAEQQWVVGHEVGWHVRLDRKFSDRTRLLVATEGILTARLQQDPLLSAFGTVVLDEFHERSIHADLGLALAKEAWRARDDFGIVVMSATLDAGAVSRFLDDCPVLDIPGSLHRLDVEYAPGRGVTETTLEAIDGQPGDILCFQPGAGEIERAIAELRPRVSPSIDVLPLHGGLDLEAQQAVISPSGQSRRRIILATNIAETSVTVPGVRTVVDAGLQKVARFDADRALDSLVTERITQDAADQRAGRAARLAPGIAIRLWDMRDRLRPHREPEISRVDLSAAALAVFAWGGDPLTFAWFEPPRDDRIRAAVQLLERLGAVNGGALTDTGRAMQALPLHPRLSRILIEGRWDPRVIRACAVLGSRSQMGTAATATTSDVLSALDSWRSLPREVERAEQEIRQLRPRSTETSPLSDESLRRILLAGYPDRVAQRRGRRSPRVKLSTGTGAILTRDSGVLDGEYLIALSLHASTARGAAEGRVTAASVIEGEWLTPTARRVEHTLDGQGVVRAAQFSYYDALTISETPVKVDDGEAARLLSERWFDIPRSEEDEQILRRLRFAGLDIDLRSVIERAAFGVRRVQDLSLHASLPYEIARDLERLAPSSLVVPSGRTTTLSYGDEGTVSASVKLQELFGLADTPRIGPRQVPLIVCLLAPNGRPVQTTTDLRSFWSRTYPEVRKELRGRYPRHPWPENPWEATPTARTQKALRRRSDPA